MSIVQYRLSQFLSLSNLCLYKSEFYFQYVDKIFSSNKYDTNFYKHLIESNNKNEFNHINPIIKEYFRIHNIIYLNTSKLKIKNQIFKINKKIEDTNILINSLLNRINNNDFFKTKEFFF